MQSLSSTLWLSWTQKSRLEQYFSRGTRFFLAQVTLYIFSPVVSHDRNIPGSQLSGVLLPGSGRARVNCELSGTLLQLEPEFLPPPQCYTSSGHQPRPLSQTTSDDNNVTDHRSLDHLGASCWLFTSCGHWEQWVWGWSWWCEAWSPGHIRASSVMRMLTIRAPVTRTLSVTTYGNGAANILTLIALLRVNAEDNWAKDSF